MSCTLTPASGFPAASRTIPRTSGGVLAVAPMGAKLSTSDTTTSAASRRLMRARPLRLSLIVPPFRLVDRWKRATPGAARTV